MPTKKLSISERKKINETIRFLKNKSQNAINSEIEKTRKEIHSLQNKLDIDELIIVKKKTSITKKKTLKAKPKSKK